MSRGAIYVISNGSESRFLEAAVRSATSLRRAMPGLAVTLVSNGEGNPVFTSQAEAPDTTDPFLAKVEAMGSMYYDETLFLDVDTLVVGDIAAGFALLDRFDLAAAQTPVASTFTLPELVHLPSAFYELNTGVLLFTRRSGGFMRAWLDAYKQLGMTESDQPAFRSALYDSDVRFVTLPPAFNVRLALFGMVNEPVVLHGWADPREMELLGQAFVADDVRVFAGERLFTGYGKLRIDYRARRRLRLLRSLLLRRL